MTIERKIITGEPKQSVYPASVDDTDVGGTLDFDGCSLSVVAFQMVGAVNGTNPTLDGKIQESPDGTTWSDIPGAVFTQVTTSNQVEAIVATRTMRYLRHTRTVSGTTPTFVLAAAIMPVSERPPQQTTIVLPPGMTALFG